MKKQDWQSKSQKIGSWINGKTLYQKTIDIGELPSASEKLVPHNIENVEHFVNISGFYHQGQQYCALPCASNGNDVNALAYKNHSNYGDNIRIIVTYQLNANFKYYGYVTVQYTKTTD